MGISADSPKRRKSASAQSFGFGSREACRAARGPRKRRPSFATGAESREKRRVKGRRENASPIRLLEDVSQFTQWRLKFYNKGELLPSRICCSPCANNRVFNASGVSAKKAGTLSRGSRNQAAISGVLAISGVC